MKLLFRGNITVMLNAGSGMNRIQIAVGSLCIGTMQILTSGAIIILSGSMPEIR